VLPALLCSTKRAADIGRRRDRVAQDVERRRLSGIDVWLPFECAFLRLCVVENRFGVCVQKVVGEPEVLFALLADAGRVHRRGAARGRRPHGR
jgi:hypothetical protein